MPISSTIQLYSSPTHATACVESSQLSQIPMQQCRRYCALKKALKLVNANRKSECVGMRRSKKGDRGETAETGQIEK